MNYETLKQEETTYVMGTYARYPVAFVKGEGCRLWDTEGKEYLDLGSGIGVVSLGHCYPPLVEAISRQAATLIHVSNLYTTIPMVETAKQLCQHSGMRRVFFCNSGAEANEGVIKTARKYSFDRYGENRNRIITLQNSFHGRTITALKATGQEKFHQYFFPFTEGFDYAPANDFAALEQMVDEHTCAVMMELIQGEGGVLPLDPEYVQRVAALCAQKDILLIIDEVQTGIGRTGSLFCYQQYGILPDLVSVAKGLGGGVPIGAVLAGEKCMDTLGNGSHGTTFGGTPLICAAANAVLPVVTDPAFLEQVRQKGAYLKEQILALRSPKVHGVRGMGLMLGISVDPDKQKEYVLQLMEKGVLVLTAGKDAIRLLPPLIITKEEIDRAVAAMKEVFA